MNPDETTRFSELAARRLAGTITPEEARELEACIAADPMLGEEVDQLEKDIPVIRDALALCMASQAPAVTPRAEILSRLRAATAARQRSVQAWWRRLPLLLLGVLVALALSTLVGVKRHDRQAVEYQIGRMEWKGIEHLKYKVVPPLEPLSQRLFPGGRTEVIQDLLQLQDWTNSWPRSDNHPVVKVLLEPDSRISFSSGQVRVWGRWSGKEFQRTIPVQDQGQWTSALDAARQYVVEQTR